MALAVRSVQYICLDLVSIAIAEGANKPSDTIVSVPVPSRFARWMRGTRWVVVAHAFVAGAATSESERKIVVGGIETIPPSTFEGANYVALGHLHRPQTAGGDHIVYSGFSFDRIGLMQIGP